MFGTTIIQDYDRDGDLDLTDFAVQFRYDVPELGPDLERTHVADLAESLRAHPPDGDAAPDAPPEERLRERLRALMHRIADPETKDFFISQMEIANPTGLLEEVMKRELIPMREKTLAMVRELLGPDADERRVVFCETCIISMCVHPLIMCRLGQKTSDARLPAIVNALEAFADHVVRFALAGILASRTPARAS
jgi:AcrR family transcriptional regulator